jgi:hypothetical protein
MAAELSKDLPVVSYNLGNVYHQKMMEAKAAPAAPAGNGPTSREWADRAATAYKQATDSPWQSLAAQAYFNLGTTYARDGKIDEAILALHEALRLLPDDADTKHNLELLLRVKKTQKKDATLPLKVKTFPEKPKMQKGKGLGQDESGAGAGGGETGKPGGGGQGENPAGDSAQGGSPGAGSDSAAGGGSGGTPENPGGSGAGTVNQADDKKQDRLAQKDSSKQTGETQKTAKTLSTDPAGDAAQQQAAASSTTRTANASSQDSSVSNLSHRDQQVLHKANELEQRMVDGWARPPDFKKPVEKDW